MTTAAERLKQLSGLAGASAAAMLLAIGSGATAGAALVEYSGLASGTAVEHLLAEGDAVPPAPTSQDGGQVIVRKAPKALPAIAVPARMADAGIGADALAPTAEVAPRMGDAGQSADAAGRVAEVVLPLDSLGAAQDGMVARGEIDPAVTLAEAAAIVAWMRANV